MMYYKTKFIFKEFQVTLSPRAFSKCECELQMQYIHYRNRDNLNITNYIQREKVIKYKSTIKYH